MLSRDQRDRLRQRGIDVTLTRVKGGRTVRQYAAAQARGGFRVWRSYDEPAASATRCTPSPAAPGDRQAGQARDHGSGARILAIKLTQGARRQADGSRPAVLFSSTQHAREWITTEVNRRLMRQYVDGWRAHGRVARRLLRTTELWFVLVANPDGYQYTFDHERLWRKNLRDNDGNGEITVRDGVDPNRNFPDHWGYDDEGSSSLPPSETYRGPSPASEPETRALKGLLDRIGFAFQVNWHSAGQWLLYAEGWQIGTPTADDPIYYALSGNLDQPGDQGLPSGPELGRPLRRQR